MDLILWFALGHVIIAYAVAMWIFSEQTGVYHGWESFVLPLFWELVPLLILTAWTIRKLRH